MPFGGGGGGFGGGAGGSQGPQGPSGGAQGAQGAQGVQGAQGTQGNQGFQGGTGVGAQGFQGDPGAQGAQGAAGTNGTQGPQGFQGAAGGGGGSFPDFTGSGSPEGVRTANVGQSYVDSTNGALYWKRTGAGNTGWVAGDNLTGSAGAIPQIGFFGGAANIIGSSAGGALISDQDAQSGTGNALTWLTTGTDGQQRLDLLLGSTGQFDWSWNANGSTTFPGPISTKPTDSHTATASFNGSPLAIGTPKQNTLGYDIAVNVSIPVSAAVGGSLNVGVGPSATPTVDPITPALSAAGSQDWSGIVPAGYYLSVTTTGTITAGTPVVHVTPV